MTHWILLIICLAWLAAITVWGWLYVRRLSRLQAQLGEKTVVERLEECLAQLGELSGKSEELRQELDRTLLRQRAALRHVGLVRYNAYEDAGGQISFSLALIDDHQSGAVLSGIAGRSDFRAYCKRIDHGRSNVPLSPEEQEALARATKDDASVDPASEESRRPRVRPQQ